MGIDKTRHEIFLQRAREEFAKGHYGPAIQFTNYPLTLKETLPEPDAAALWMLVLLLGLSLHGYRTTARPETDQTRAGIGRGENADRKAH